jgi:hypothetical protein
LHIKVEKIGRGRKREDERGERRTGKWVEGGKK